MRIRRFVVVLLLSMLVSFAARSASAAQPRGYVDGIDWDGTLVGWAIDDDCTTCALQVHVFIDYKGMLPRQFLTWTITNENSSDVQPYDGVTKHRFRIPFVKLGTQLTWGQPQDKIYLVALSVNSQGALDGDNVYLNPSGLTPTTYPDLMTTGVNVKDFDAACHKPVQVQVWVLDETSTWRLHNIGYTNIPAHPDPQNRILDTNDGNYGVYVPYKFPLPISFAPGRIFVRTIRMGSNCVDYDPATWQDHYSTSIHADPHFRGVGRSVVMPPPTETTWKYRLSMDRHGGAIYEFYNLRINDPALPYNPQSALHANMGAALGIAIHAGDSAPDIFEPTCAETKGHWNPTQTGAFCSPSRDVTQLPIPGDAENLFNVSCASTVGGTLTVDNGCTQAYKAQVGEHRMLNWDYTPLPGPTVPAPYPGPYNELDRMKLAQTVNAEDPQFVVIDIAVRNDSNVRRTGIIEMPTFYFTNQFRQFYAPTGAGSMPTGPTITLPDRPGDTDDQNKSQEHFLKINGSGLRECYDPGWMTAQNTFATGAEHPFITIAWFYKHTPTADDQPTCGPDHTYSPWDTYVGEQRYHDTVKFTNTPRITFPANMTTPAEFRYVIFPYKYDEVITYQGAPHSVAEAIWLMRQAYSVQ